MCIFHIATFGWLIDLYLSYTFNQQNPQNLGCEMLRNFSMKEVKRKNLTVASFTFKGLNLLDLGGKQEMFFLLSKQ